MVWMRRLVLVWGGLMLMTSCIQRPDLKLDNPKDPLSPTYQPPPPPGVPLPDDMVFMPAVTGFSMGRPSGLNEVGMNYDEEPFHGVNLAPFYISKYEVTVAQYCAFLNSGAQDNRYDSSMDDSQFCGIRKIADGKYEVLPGRENYPVTFVSWSDAKAYCDWLTQKTGKTWRLPTEAEWEYAAKGGNPHRTYPWGNTWDSAKLRSLDATMTGPARVGSYPEGKSPHGLFDMAGNVSEWVEDWYDANYYTNKTVVDNPRGPDTGSLRVRRGGSFNDGESKCRCAARDGGDPATTRQNDIGFRVVRLP